MGYRATRTSILQRRRTFAGKCSIVQRSHLKLLLLQVWRPLRFQPYLWLSRRASALHWSRLLCSMMFGTGSSSPRRPGSRHQARTVRWMPTLLEAFAETVTVPETVALAAGAVTETVGGGLVVPLFVENAKSLLIDSTPLEFFECTR